MLRFKTPQTLLVYSLALLMTTACSDANLSFNAEPVACETPGSSVKNGASGPVILYPTIESVVRDTVKVTGSCVSGVPVEVKEASGAVTKVDCVNGMFSLDMKLSSGDGQKDLMVQQSTASDGGLVVDRLCFQKDTVPPAVTITNGNSSQSSNTTSTQVTGRCESGLQVIISGPGLVNPVTTDCNNGTFTATVQVNPGDGTKNIVGTQIDRAGNQGAASSSVNVDTTAPVVRITSPIPTVTNQSSLTVSGVCETGLPVEIGELRATTAPAATCTNGTFTASIPLIGADGPVNARVFQVDTAGNIGFDVKSLIKDTVAPAVTITSPLANAYITPTTTFSGACETGLAVQLSGSVLSAATSVACTSGQWTLTSAISAGQGSKTLIAAQTDAAGNVGQKQQSFTVDTVAPVIAITAPAANSYIGASFQLTGTCETGLTVQIAGAGVLPPTSTACTNGAFSATVSASSLDGTKVVTASQTDAAGNTGTTSRNFLRDSLGPVLTITSPANGTRVGASITLTGACEAGLTVTFTGDVAASSSVVCAANGTYSAGINLSAADGTKNITAREVDAAGNASTATGSYLRDTTAPVVAITSPAPNTTGQTGLIVGGTCEAGLNVSLSGTGVASTVSTPCSAQGTFSASITFSAGSGSKQVIASQTDLAGNTGSDTETFISDSTAPTVTITAPAANSYLPTTFTVQGACETGLQVTVGGAGVASAVTAACTAGAYSANVTVSAGDGAKVVSASQTDAAGNVATAQRSFLRDTTAPVLTISSPANGTTAQNGILLVGTCETGLTVQISGAGISAPTSVTCASGAYQANLTFSAGDGAKTVLVSETDAAGNSSQVVGTFNRDATPPAVAITSPAADTAGQNGLTIGGTCEAGLNVVLTGTGLASSSTVPCSASGTFTADITFSSGSGTKTVIASQTDATGNTGSSTRNFVRDLSVPAVTITSPAANSYVATTFTVQGACETGLQVTLTGTGLASAVTATCPAGTYSASVTVSAGEGTKAVIARQTDAVGNVGEATRSFLRDTVAPVLTITSPANGTTAQNGILLVGTCETGLTVQISGSGISAPISVTCASGAYQANLTFSAGDGAKTVLVSETDAAGNNSQVTGTFNRDATPPAVAITSPAADTPGQNGLTIGGTCEAGLNVSLTGTGLASSSTVACSASGTFTADITFSNGSGTKTVTASQTDAMGNTGTSTRNFVRDLVAPIVTITAPAANSYLAASFTVQGACETGLQVTVTGAGVATAATVPCTAGAYSATVNVSSGDGTKVVIARQTDAVGNIGEATRSFLRDTAAPALTITSPANGASVPTSATLTGTCEAGLTVAITGAITSTSASCAAGTFSANIVFTAGLGAKNVQVQQTDAAGNVGQATAQYMRDSNAGSETFVADASFGKIDILFIDDNSASMDPKQASLGSKFAGFASELMNIDWQIGITTTDCSTGPYGICGSLLPLTGVSSKILTPNTANYQTVFNNSIQRPETAGCLDRGDCPAGASEPLLSATTAMNKRNTDNSGFFRANSDLAIVILSDADERQTGGATYANRPAELVQAFNTNWPADKKLKVYSIIVQPGDSTCLATMKAGSNGFSFYGDLVNQTVNLTAGLSTSICAPDYTVTLKSIGESVRTLTNSVTLAHTPVAGSVVVTLTPNQNITYKVIGNQVVFDAPPSVGTEIKVDYQY